MLDQCINERSILPKKRDLAAFGLELFQLRVTQVRAVANLEQSVGCSAACEAADEWSTHCCEVNAVEATQQLHAQTYDRRAVSTGGSHCGARHGTQH